MAREAGGWHTATVENVRPGEAYAFSVRSDMPAVPDPASRSNPWDVNAPSAVVDPALRLGGRGLRAGPERGRVYYLPVALHAGVQRSARPPSSGYLPTSASPRSSAAYRRLRLGALGLRRRQYAPDAAYGSPEDLKRLVNEAHKRGLMVLLDVVYNHFGPDGNYLSTYSPQFFNEAHQTPWGAAINFDGEHCGTVRDFFRHNALYWLEEYHFDGCHGRDPCDRDDSPGTSWWRRRGHRAGPA